MRFIVTSDTHENGANIRKVVEYAQKSGITRVVDCGDLHGSIESFEGVKLNAVYWARASGAMDSERFYRAIGRIDGIVHENGTCFKLEEILGFIQHNLAEYEQQIPQSQIEMANAALDEVAAAIQGRDFTRFIFFGHTHTPHFNNDGKSIAINPGTTGLEHSESTFAVVDTEKGTVEFRDMRDTIVTVPFEGEFAQVRELRNGRYIAKLKNGREVFVYKEKGQEKRTEDYARIFNAANGQHGLSMKVLTDNGKQQLILGGWKSKAFDKIGNTFNEYDAKSEPTGRYKAYVAQKTVKGKAKEVLVVGEKERESKAFDKISDVSPIVKEGLVAFVGKTKSEDYTEDRALWEQDKNYVDNLVVNNKVVKSGAAVSQLEELADGFAAKMGQRGKQSVLRVGLDGTVAEGATYESISVLEKKDGKLVYVAKNEGKMFVVVDGVEQMKHDAPKGSWDHDIRRVEIADGKLAYITRDAGETALFFEGREVARAPVKDKYSGDGISDAKIVGGKLAYVVKSPEGVSRVIYDGRTIAEDAKIDWIAVRDGNLAYRKGNDWYSADGNKIANGNNADEAGAEE